MSLLPKFCRRQPAFNWIVLGLTVPPFLFIVHEIVSNHQQEYDVTSIWHLPDSRDLAKSFHLRRPHELDWRAGLLRDLKSDLVDAVHGGLGGGDKFLHCRAVDTIDKKEHIGRGVTKDVYRGVHEGRSVALKMVTDKVEDIKACWRRNKYKRRAECYVFANYKLLKEMALSLQLNHPNVVKGLGLCIRSNSTAMGSHGVISVYELGDKTASSLLSRLPWDRRLDMAVEIADLLDYLEHSPLGSLALWDFKTRQFTLVQGRITLIDLDDVSAQELSCVRHEDCNVEVDTQSGRENIVANSSGLVPCVNSTCYGLNAKFNVISASRGLLGGALLSSPPPFVQHQIDSIMALGRQGGISAKQLKESLLQLRFIKRTKKLQ